MLPFCFGDCNYKRMKNNSKCLGNHADGMSLIEKIKLDYYYDKVLGNW